MDNNFSNSFSLFQLEKKKLQKMFALYSFYSVLLEKIKYKKTAISNNFVSL